MRVWYLVEFGGDLFGGGDEEVEVFRANDIDLFVCLQSFEVLKEVGLLMSWCIVGHFDHWLIEVLAAGLWISEHPCSVFVGGCSAGLHGCGMAITHFFQVRYYFPAIQVLKKLRVLLLFLLSQKSFAIQIARND